MTCYDIARLVFLWLTSKKDLLNVQRLQHILSLMTVLLEHLSPGEKIWAGNVYVCLHISYYKQAWASVKFLPLFFSQRDFNKLVFVSCGQLKHLRNWVSAHVCMHSGWWDVCVCVCTPFICMFCTLYPSHAHTQTHTPIGSIGVSYYTRSQRISSYYYVKWWHLKGDKPFNFSHDTVVRLTVPP